MIVEDDRVRCISIPFSLFPPARIYRTYRLSSRVVSYLLRLDATTLDVSIDRMIKNSLERSKETIERSARDLSPRLIHASSRRERAALRLNDA